MILLILLPLSIFFSCSSANIGGDGRKANVYLTQENGKIYRTERQPVSFYLKAKGEVKFSCSSSICSKEELEKPEKEIKALIKEGMWEEYVLKELDGQGDKAEEDKKFISVKIRVGEYKNNLKEGIWKTLREDGSTLIESEYKNDKKKWTRNEIWNQRTTD